MPTVGIQRAVYDDYDFDVNSLILASNGGVDYSMTEFMLGATLVTPGEKRPVKDQFLGLTIGTGDLEAQGISSSLVETSLGSIWYFDDEGMFVPFVSLFGTLSNTSKIPDLGNQGGIRFGAGVEYPIASNVSASIGADYLLPVYDAKTSSGIAEATLEGVAIRFGMNFMF